MSNEYAYIRRWREGYAIGAGDGFTEGKRLADQVLSDIEVAAKNEKITREELIELINEARVAVSFSTRIGRKE